MTRLSRFNPPKNGFTFCETDLVQGALLSSNDSQIRGDFLEKTRNVILVICSSQKLTGGRIPIGSFPVIGGMLARLNEQPADAERGGCTLWRTGVN